MLSAYRYAAYTQDGKLRKGSVDAASANEAHLSLERLGLIPVEIREDAGEAAKWWARDVSFGRKALPASALARLASTLQTLLDAGIGLPDALAMAAESIPDKRSRRALRIAHDRILKGAPIGEAFGQDGGTLSAEFIGFLDLGDRSNRLSMVLAAAARLYAARAEARAKITSALIYPVILICAAIVLFGVLVFFLAPTLAPIFAAAEVTPNATLALLFRIHEQSSSETLAVAAAALVFLFGGLFVLPGAVLRQAVEPLVVRLPMVEGLVTATALGQIGRSLSLLTGAGEPLPQALEDAGRNAPRRYRQLLSEAADAVRSGASPVPPFESGDIPASFRQLLAVAHETNSWERTMESVATLMEAEATRTRDRLLQLLTPALTLLIGLMMGAVMLSIVTALLDLNTLVLQ